MTKKEKIEWDHMLDTLEHYQQKNHSLNNEIEQLKIGAGQVSQLVDGIMAEVAFKYGEVVTDDVKVPEVAKILGYRVVLPVPTMDKGQVKVEKKDGELIIGLFPEDEKNG